MILNQLLEKLDLNLHLEVTMMLMEKQKEKDIQKLLQLKNFPDQVHMIYLIMLKDLVIVYLQFILQFQLKEKIKILIQQKVMKDYLKKIIGM